MNAGFVSSISSVFLLAVGASPFQVGLLATTHHLARVTRVLGLWLIPRLGKAGLMFWGRGGALLPTAGLVALAWGSEVGYGAIWAALGLLGTRHLLHQLGSTAWWPLVQDNAGEGSLGAFLASMRTKQRSLELVLPIAVGWYLGASPPPDRFALPFALALVSTSLGAWFVRRVR